MGINVKPGAQIPGGAIPVGQAPKPFWQSWVQFGTQLGGVAAQITQMQQQLDGIHTWLTPNERLEPTPYIFKGARVTPSSASTYSVVPIQAPFMGGPQGGLRWELAAWFIFGTDPFTSIANAQVALFLGGAPGPIDSPTAPTTDYLLSTSGAVGTIPWTGTLARSVVIQPGDSIYFVVKNAGNSQALTAAVQVLQFSERRPISP